MGMNYFEKLTDKQLLAVYTQAQKMEAANTKNIELKLQNPIFKSAVDFYDRIVDTPNKVALDQLYAEAAKRWADNQMTKTN